MEINVNWLGMTGIDKCRIATALKPLKEQNVVSLHELHEALGLAEPQHIVLDFDIKDENGKRAQGLHVHYILGGINYIGSYGDTIISLGIFSSLDKANEAKEQAVANVNFSDEWERSGIKCVKESMRIIELTLDEAGRFTKFDECWDYLLGDEKVKEHGGYVE